MRHISLTFIILVSGCTSEQWKGAALGALSAAGNIPSTARQTYSVPNYLDKQKVMIFGGAGHKIYLGCISCSQYDSDSILNYYGNYGSRYSSTSILNSYSDFGSRYSNYSACNPYASDPPVIVNSQGTFYGRLTINQNNHQRTNDKEINSWILAVCSRS